MYKILFIISIIVGCSAATDFTKESLIEEQQEEQKINDDTNSTPSSEYSDGKEDIGENEGETEFIIWDLERPLSWNDFVGEIELNSNYKAKTFSKINFESRVTKDSIYLNIPCFFITTKSWVKERFRQNNLLLEHEQLHFDIAELVARKIREECSKHRSVSLSESSEVLQNIYDKFYYEFWDELNFHYDEETNHSVIRERQLEWEIKIKNELDLLSKYESTIVVIPRL